MDFEEQRKRIHAQLQRCESVHSFCQKQRQDAAHLHSMCEEQQQRLFQWQESNQQRRDIFQQMREDLRRVQQENLQKRLLRR